MLTNEPPILASTGSLADFTAADLIAPQLEATEKASVIQALCRMLQRHHRWCDSLPFYQAVMNREYLSATTLPDGIAIPHARVPEVKELCFSFGRCTAPLRWGAKNLPSVRFVFLVAVPSTDATAYLTWLAALARLQKGDGLLRLLNGAATPSELLAALRMIPLRPTRATPHFAAAH